MDVNCPSCHRKLRVPDGSAGRRARCPGCDEKFVVADPRDMLEETISGWIVDDVQNIAAMRMRHQKLAEEEGIVPGEGA